LATRAPVAVDRVFGDLGLEVGWYILYAAKNEALSNV